MPNWTLPHRFAHDGDAIAFDRVGHGPPLVFLHGTPFSSFVWRRIAPLFAAEREVILLDLAGYGQSAMHEGQDVSLGRQGVMFAAFLAAQDIAPPDVVAHDFGGATCLRAHLLDEFDYRSLTLIDPVAIAPWGSPFVQHVRAHEAAFAGLPAYIHAAILPAYLQGAAYRPLAAEAMAGYVAPWLGSDGQPAFYRQIVQMDQRYTDEIEPLLGRMRCPVQLLWGEEDAWIPLERGRTLAARLGLGKPIVIPEAGHLVQEDAPEAIVAALLRFLKASA